ncbi:restriction endonuclease subunit S [Acetivibrio saccincola]|uniref:Type I restriction modification DNA specificity domain protein n=1 Tax=Acetivibrio saccincola TaxID=1677857 RepID=A0A2K9DXP5_9FIRM|nr:restriction endonuclease subunit S [Acetivibrio saccincola]AUG56282.1 Type I restriction modification DNA specificity domain protein [Acetivibrio saccincola]
MSVSEWRETNLDEVLSFYNGKKRPTESGNIPVYGGNGILSYCNSYNTEGESLIIGRVGAYCGNVFYENKKCWISDNAILAKAKTNVSCKFMYYILKHTNLNDMHIGSSQPLLTQGILKGLTTTMPRFAEQKAIAATLSALDDMIELNNQINKTLEEMAQAIFKSWFVDFEPFKDGEFEESELGLIPKGWRVVELGEITEEIRERVKDRKIPVFSAVKTGDLVLSEDYFTKQVFSRDISKYIVVKPFDFAYNPARINIGSIGINEFSYTGCVSPVYVVFRTDQKYKWFFKMLTRTERFKKEVNTRASGSVRQTLNFDEFSKIKVVYPYAEIVEEYNYIFEGLIMAKSKIEEEISILSEIRDTLLPKLMSGEIRVPVEEVV